MPLIGVTESVRARVGLVVPVLVVVFRRLLLLTVEWVVVVMSSLFEAGRAAIFGELNLAGIGSVTGRERGI